jgi:hypothetical protein
MKSHIRNPKDKTIVHGVASPSVRYLGSHLNHMVQKDDKTICRFCPRRSGHDIAPTPQSTHKRANCLRSLLPCRPHTDQTANSTGDTDDTVVEVEVAQSGSGHGNVADIRDELETGSGALSVEIKSNTVSNRNVGENHWDKSPNGARLETTGMQD